jgi:hypothetical protein
MKSMESRRHRACNGLDRRRDDYRVSTLRMSPILHLAFLTVFRDRLVCGPRNLGKHKNPG